MGGKDKSFFWVGYADLMTNLFFIMLLLFGASIVIMIAKDRQSIDAEKEKQVTEQALKRLEEQQNARMGSSLYYAYDSLHRKYVLNVNVRFRAGSYNMNELTYETRSQLRAAGREITEFIQNKALEHRISYVLVIEGQASRDAYRFNDELSYNRALALYKDWFDHVPLLPTLENEKLCEVLIVGSGLRGVMRDRVEAKNQRFLITLFPKTNISDFQIQKTIEETN